MRLIIFFIFLNFTTYSQENIKVVKMCSLFGDKSFTNKNFKSQDIFFKGDVLIGQINYSYNGWQIYDSIAYETKGLNLCLKTFAAIYDVNEKLFKKYKYIGVNCDEQVVFSNKHLNKVNDKYLLSRPYLKILDLLLTLNPNKVNNHYFFNKGIIPTIFTEYGIPSNEVLNSFSFNIIHDNNLISNDEFYFLDYIVKRKYRYLNSVLQSVTIIVESTKNLIIREYEEKYIITPLR